MTKYGSVEWLIHTLCLSRLQTGDAWMSRFAHECRRSTASLRHNCITRPRDSAPPCEAPTTCRYLCQHSPGIGSHSACAESLLRKCNTRRLLRTGHGGVSQYRLPFARGCDNLHSPSDLHPRLYKVPEEDVGLLPKRLLSHLLLHLLLLQWPPSPPTTQCKTKFRPGPSRTARR